MYLRMWLCIETDSSTDLATLSVAIFGQVSKALNLHTCNVQTVTVSV